MYFLRLTRGSLFISLVMVALLGVLDVLLVLVIVLVHLLVLDATSG